MKFKTRMINAAVAAALGTVAGAAQAVNLGADGQGQVLIYPYYTVQTKGASNAFDTYVSIVNSDSVRGKAVKVRFIESKNSYEVLDFNLYLSPNDMWTGVVTRDSGGNAMLRTSDNSCTAPEIPIASGTVREVSFMNSAYATDNVKDSALARAKEGYLEVIQMADLVSLNLNGNGLDTWAASKHNSAGVPANCQSIRDSWQNGGYDNGSGVNIPTGGLSGAATIINPNEGTDISYDAVPLVSFTDSIIHFPPESASPNLGNVSPAISAVLDTSSMVVTNWGARAPAEVPITAILMRHQLLNEFAIAQTPVALGTDWIIAMPTKRAHIAIAATAQGRAPFQTTSATITTSGFCETITLTTYNREEGQQTSGLNFSPPGTSNALCWEVSLISWGVGTTVSNVLGGVTTRQIIANPTYDAGWIRIGFNQPSQKLIANNGASTRFTYLPTLGTSTINATYFGLPVLGFSAVTFVNTSSLSSYGSAYTHRYGRTILP